MDEQRLERTANLLLEIGSTLMVSGANTGRANITIDRFAEAFQCKATCLLSHRSIVLTLTDNESELTCTKVQSIPSYHLNFSIISELSIASWKTIHENWELEYVELELIKIKNSKRYPKFVLLIAISLAGAGFCNIFKGDSYNMLVAFISTFIGFSTLLYFRKKMFNPFISIFAASFIASFSASIGVYYSIGLNPQTALATSILFLVPGVPLINSFIDFFDNNVVNGSARFTTALLTIIAMSIGLFLTMLLFHFN